MRERNSARTVHPEQQLFKTIVLGKLAGHTWETKGDSYITQFTESILGE